MKKLFIMLFMLFAVCAKAQKGAITFSTSYGNGNGQRKPIAAKAELQGFSSKGPIKTFDLGASLMISKHLALTTGVSILNHRYQYTSFYNPDITPVVDKSINTLIFPVKLKVDVFKYFFISGGFLLNSDIGINEGKGVDVGFGIGAGVQYYFKNQYGIFIYPQTNIHTLAIGLSEQHVAVGLAYKILKK